MAYLKENAGPVQSAHARPTVALHVEMEAFFAAVEQWDHPELRGKPLLIGHDGLRGLVATVSYKTQPFEGLSAQPMVVARSIRGLAGTPSGEAGFRRAASRTWFQVTESTTS